jgi:phosphate transport system permease protein
MSGTTGTATGQVPAVPTAEGAATSPAPPARTLSLTGWRRWISSPIAFLPAIFLIAIVITLIEASKYSLVPGLFGSVWNPDPTNPALSTYGVAYFAVGSLITSTIALALAMVLSIALALSLAIFLPSVVSRLLTPVTDLLAGIPSVVYGIWGYVVLAPYFSTVIDPGLAHWLGWLPGFSANPTEYAGGVGLILAIFVLTIMVVPLTTALIRDSLRAVPRDLVESGLALGATRWEVARRVQLRYARNSIPSALLLGFGRAVGETVAVAMVIGNEVKLPDSIFSGSSTIASLLITQTDSALQYPELLQALVEIALILLAISIAVNLIGLRYFGRSRLAVLGTVQ